MTSRSKSFTGKFVGSPLDHPAADQVAAFCYRQGDSGVQILLVTSSRGRWILPKGWPMAGHTAAEVAQEEAWEEAGVRKGVTSANPILSYRSIKRTKRRGTMFTRVSVHTIAVTEMSDDFPESATRKRRWVTPAQAQAIICEDSLRAAFADLVDHVETDSPALLA